MFITAYFTIARTWNQPRCPSDGWMMHYIHTMEFYSTTKKNEIFKKLDGTMKQDNPGSELYFLYVLSPDYTVKYVYLCGSKYG